ncbi:MAG: transporter, partial [Planctomycetota bacterium]
FGTSATLAASALFLVTRNLGDGLRLFLAAIVLQKIAGWSFAASAVAIGATTIFYTYMGGMRSVVWNDCIQFVIYMLGGIASVFLLLDAIPGGWETLMEYADREGKLQVFAFAPPPDSTSGFWGWLVAYPYSFWAGLVGGAVLTLGTHGTDQMMVQRYLSARSQRDAGRAIVCSALVVALQFALFLFIGVQLACYYSFQPDIVFAKTDEVYAHFIVHSFPRNTGLIGLMLAAILAAAMSTLSSSLNASAAAIVNDFYLPFRRAPASPRHALRVSRGVSVLFGLLQIGIAIWATTFSETVVANALTIAGFSAGTLLGLFLLGVFTDWVGQSAALIGGACGLGVLAGLQFLLPAYTSITVAWPWFALIGASVTFVVGWLVAALLRMVNRLA